MSGDGVGRGYTLAKGAIAEDVEEEEAEDGKGISSLFKFYLLRKIFRLS